MNTFAIRKGDILWFDLPYTGNVQGGKRPCVVVTASRNAIATCPNLNVIPLSTKMTKAKRIPTHVMIDGLKKPSYAITEQIITVPKTLMLSNHPVFSLDQAQLELLNCAIRAQLGC